MTVNGALSGTGAIALEAGGLFTAVQTGASTYSGSIAGGGTFAKQGAGTLTLDGPLNVSTLNVDAGTLNVKTNASNATVNVTANANFGASQTLTALNIIGTGVVGLTAPSPAGLSAIADDDPVTATDDALLDAFIGERSSHASGSDRPVPAVPEPGSFALLLAGALGLLSRRRSAPRV